MHRWSLKQHFQTASKTQLTYGALGITKLDEFLEEVQTPFDQPPLFRNFLICSRSKCLATRKVTQKLPAKFTVAMPGAKNLGLLCVHSTNNCGVTCSIGSVPIKKASGAQEVAQECIHKQHYSTDITFHNNVNKMWNTSARVKAFLLWKSPPHLRLRSLLSSDIYTVFKGARCWTPL